MKVTTPKQFETLAQFVSRAKFSKKNALEQASIELKEKIGYINGLYSKAGDKKGMDKKKAKELATMLEPLFSKLEEIEVNLLTAIKATAKAKS